MTEDLRPKSHLGAILATAISVAGAAWGASSWLQGRADKPAVERVSDEQVRMRIDQTVMTGKIERVEQSQQRLEKAVERVELKLDPPRRRRSNVTE